MALSARQAHLLEWTAVGLILLLAGVLRLARPDLTEFKADEARLLGLALDMAQGDFAVRGISSSVGFPNFPMSVWFYALPSAVWPHPYAATLFTGLLNTVAVAGCYWIVRRYWGISAALAATLMLAVSPWAVIFSRKIWAQNLLPLVVTVWGASALLAFVDKRRALAAVHIVALGAAIQIHLAAVGLAPATALYLIVFRRRVAWKWVLLGVGLALLTAAPFLGHLIQQQQSLASIAGGTGSQDIGFSLKALRLAAMLSLGSNLHSLAGPEAFGAYLEAVGAIGAVVVVLWAVFLLGGVGWAVYRIWKGWPERQSQALLVVLAWLVAPVLFFSIAPTGVFVHYFIATLPAQYIMAGVFFQAVVSRFDQRLRPLAWLVLIASAVAQVIVTVGLISYVNMNNTPGGYGTPLGMKLEAAETARRLVADGANEVIVAGYGSSPDVDEFPAEFQVLLRDVPHRFADLSAEALFPAGRAAVLIDGRSDSPNHNTGDLYQAAATALETIPLRTGEGEFLVVDLPGGAAPSADFEPDPRPLWANFVQLIGYDNPASTNEGSVLWQFIWQPADNPDSQPYHFFNHLVDTEGQRVSQADGPAFSGLQWQPGDQVISRFWLDRPSTPADALHVLLGMYRFPEQTNVPLLDEAANPAGDFYEVQFASE